jgi:hypothetical protein
MAIGRSALMLVAVLAAVLSLAAGAGASGAPANGLSTHGVPALSPTPPVPLPLTGTPNRGPAGSPPSTPAHSHAAPSALPHTGLSLPSQFALATALLAAGTLLRLRRAWRWRLR